MNDTSQEVAFSINALRRLAQPKPQVEVCEFCSVTLDTKHRHLMETSTQQLWCVCHPCALRFENTLEGRFKSVPRDAVALPTFLLTDEQWATLALPINLAFFFNSSRAGKVTAMYPSPGGAMESLLTFQDWGSLVVDNPVLDKMQTDVEALLVNRIGTAREYFITPIDACYELAGLVRTHWRGLSGGDKVWAEIEGFFRALKMQTEPIVIEPRYARA